MVLQGLRLHRTAHAPIRLNDLSSFLPLGVRTDRLHLLSQRTCKARLNAAGSLIFVWQTVSVLHMVPFTISVTPYRQPDVKLQARQGPWCRRCRRAGLQAGSCFAASGGSPSPLEGAANKAVLVSWARTSRGRPTGVSVMRVIWSITLGCIILMRYSRSAAGAT